MRAAIWNGPGSMDVGTAPDAVCPEDGVLLHVLAVSVMSVIWKENLPAAMVTGVKRPPG